MNRIELTSIVGQKKRIEYLYGVYVILAENECCNFLTLMIMVEPCQAITWTLKNANKII